MYNFMSLSDAVNTSPDLGGQNVFKTFEIAIPHNGRTTLTGLERVFCRWIYFHPPLDRPLSVHPNRNRCNLVHSATAAGFALVPSLSSFPVTQSLKRVPASALVKGGNVTSAGWQVTLCDPMWHVSSRISVATL